MSTQRDHDNPISDRSVCLCDVGGHGLAAATVVCSDGSVVPVLLLADEELVWDLHCRRVEHEQLGPLPWWWQHRVDGPVCDRPTRSGAACRARVGAWGDACYHHRAEQLAS